MRKVTYRDVAKHTFTRIGKPEYSRCGHQYCSSDTCSVRYKMPDGSYKYQAVNRCKCGFEYIGDKNKQKELEHVLNAEGLYA